MNIDRLTMLGLVAVVLVLVAAIGAAALTPGPATYCQSAPWVNIAVTTATPAATATEAVP